MLLAWLRARRRRRLLATPFPAEWAAVIERNVPAAARLGPLDRAELFDITRVLVAEKNWEGCGGLAMTDEIKVTVAAQAARLLLRLSHDYYARVLSVLVYPAGFRSPDGWRRENGVIDTEVGAAGEAWYDGPVVLAWDSVLGGGQNPDDGRNVVMHEFAHQLDFLDGVIDGTPPLHRHEDYAQWQQVMTSEFARLKIECELGEPKVLDRYGTTNPAEFFAVATETFFEKPEATRQRHPDLYAVLTTYYGQDPAGGGDATTHRTKPTRKSRKAAAAGYADVLAEWPGWVRFWELHPGVARTQALAPQEHQVTAMIGCGMVFGLAFWWTAVNGWKLNYPLVGGGLFLLAMVLLWVWLRLAVRWVDRHGFWGGDKRSAPPSPT